MVFQRKTATKAAVFSLFPELSTGPDGGAGGISPLGAE
jgi:hypothetical protein